MKKILFLVTLSMTAMALEPKNDCIEPIIPFKFRNNAEIREFNTASDIYKACIDRFIKEHHDNIDSSMASMKSAAADWTAFVQHTQKSPAYQKNVSPMKQSNNPLNVQGEKSAGSNSPTKFSTGFSF